MKSGNVSVSNISDSGSTMTAKLVLNSTVLTVSRTGTGSGTVTSSPAGIECGIDCSEVYESGTVVTLSEIADTETNFMEWRGDTDCSDGIVTMNTDVTCTAIFNLVQYQLTTSVNPSGSGIVTPDCSGECIYDSGTAVVLTATENEGYFFDSWTNCDSASNNVCTETMDANDALTANFQACYQPVRIAGATPAYYSTLQDAYDEILDGGIIQTRSVILTNDLNAYRDISVILEGGYNCNYSAVTGNTILNGLMTISDGVVTIGDYVFGN